MWDKAISEIDAYCSHTGGLGSKKNLLVFFRYALQCQRDNPLTKSASLIFRDHSHPAKTPHFSASQSTGHHRSCTNGLSCVVFDEQTMITEYGSIWKVT